MEFLVGTVVNGPREQTYYVPIKKIENMVYPDSNGGTLVIWTHSDGTIRHTSFKETPIELTVITLNGGEA